MQQIPIYIMSTLKIPNEIYTKLDSLCKQFWWRVADDQIHYFCLKAWIDMCTSKVNGGLGFKLFKDLNLALLAKLTWKLEV